jgi:hypothetical protein
MCTALARHGVGRTIIGWMTATLEGRRTGTVVGSCPGSGAVNTGVGEGGVLSPLLWCLVVDELLARLGGGCVCAGIGGRRLPSGNRKIPEYSIWAHSVGTWYC